MSTTDVLWAAWDGRGLEHLRLETEQGAVRADSLIVATTAGRPFRARYALECDDRWHLRHARIERLTPPERVLTVRVEDGRWVDGDTGATLPLDGCTDIDVYPSPFTNTLPIRRLADAVIGEPVRVTVAWVSLPALTIAPAPQEYTLLERGPLGARWRFRALDSGFTVELQVDAHGLVRDYPDIARRVL